MAYKIAVTSLNGTSIDQHFGQAEGFYILQIDEESGRWERCEFREIPDTGKSNETINGMLSCNGHDEERLFAIGRLLSDCPYLLTGKIGIRPYRFLQRMKIDCMEVIGELPPIIEKLHQYDKKQKHRLGEYLGGVQGFLPDDIRLFKAHNLARKAGLSYDFDYLPVFNGYARSVRIELEGEAGKKGDTVMKNCWKLLR